jgi:hypothetical protein
MDGGFVCDRPVSTQGTTQTQNKHTEISIEAGLTLHAYSGRRCNIREHFPSIEAMHCILFEKETVPKELTTF